MIQIEQQSSAVSIQNPVSTIAGSPYNLQTTPGQFGFVANPQATPNDVLSAQYDRQACTLLGQPSTLDLEQQQDPAYQTNGYYYDGQYWCLPSTAPCTEAEKGFHAWHMASDFKPAVIAVELNAAQTLITEFKLLAMPPQTSGSSRTIASLLVGV